MKKLVKLTVLTVLLFTCKNIVKAADYIWPIDTKNAYETYIEYNYGRRTYDSKAYDLKYPGGQLEGYYSRNENHYGVDITGIKGQNYDVISVVDGTVLTTSLDQLWNPSLSYPDRNQRNASFDGGGYGNYIVIKEDKTGKCFLYGHLKANSVTLRNGNKVTKGQKIGVMGSSGDSGHMHLHFEVRLNQKYTTTGKNLVITTRYGLETLNPTDYIGTKAPEKPVVEEKKIEQPVKPEETKEDKKIEPEKTNKDTQTKAQIINTEYSSNKDYGILTITLDKKIKTSPSINIIINSEIRKAIVLSREYNKYTYKVKYNDFDITTFGEITMEINSNNELEYFSKTIGYLNEWKIKDTYEESYYNKLGDLNKDGKVNAVDASLTLSLYSKIISHEELTEEEKDQATRADMDNNGYINSIDASLILDYYANKSTSWADEKQEKIISCDVNKDHAVNYQDYSMINAMIRNGEQNNVYDRKFDLNKDGVLNQKDEEFYKQVLREYGTR